MNGDRGDLDFDEGGHAHNECTACRFDADSWDPDPSRRGDVARALLYMDLRYDSSDSGAPDLELLHRTTSIGERHFWHLCTLLVWHEEALWTIPSGYRAFGAVGVSERGLFHFNWRSQPDPQQTVCRLLRVGKEIPLNLLPVIDVNFAYHVG